MFDETFLDNRVPHQVVVALDSFFEELANDEYIEMLQEIENMCARELLKMENSLDGCLE